MLNEGEKSQYNRQLILDEIGKKGQEKLKSAKVLVVGAGGLGCPVLQYLTAAGVGTIGIIDHDKVELSNLHRQILYTHDDIGAPKVTIAASKLNRLNPHVYFKTYFESLSVENAIDLFSEYDIIVDGTDNFPTRYLVNDAAVLTDKPVVFGSIFKFHGQVSVLNFNNGPTYRCLFPEPPLPNSVPNCSDIGVLGVLPGIIGSYQANEAIKIITGLGEILNGKLLYIDTLTLKQQVFSFSKNESISIDALEKDYHFFCGIEEIDYDEISSITLKKSLNKYQILDVRSVQEYNVFNIGGMHIPLEELDDKIMKLPHEKPIVVCCQSGVRSKAAIKKISKIRSDLELINLESGLASY